MKRRLLQIAALLAASMAAGAVRNAALSPSLPWTRLPEHPLAAEIIEAGFRLAAREEVAQASEAGWPLIFDARSQTEYDRGHIPGALSTPAQELATRGGEYAAMLGPTDPVILYCSHEACTDALRVAEVIRGDHGRDVAIYLPGMVGWRAAGGPEE